MPRFRLQFLALLIVLSGTLSQASAQRYRVGEIVENFTLTNRATNQPVRLSDFEGKVVFLEWFAYWCPYCQAAAEQVETGVVDYYKLRNGNASGVPVLHVGLNLEGGNENLSQQFINRYGMQLVLNDFNASLANRFQAGGQPIFAVINGVENSPSHQQWELVYSHLGFGNTTHPVTEFRSAIDSVQAAPELEAPTITTGPLSARLGTGSPIALTVEALGQELSYQWTKGGIDLAGETSAQLQIASATLSDAGSYAVEVSNSGGQATSLAAEVEVVLSIQDYLTNAGLTGDDLDPNADPDLDTFPNAFEYLAQSDPNAFGDAPNASLRFSSSDGVPALQIQFESASDTIGYQLFAHFWSDPAEAGRVTLPLVVGQSSQVSQAIPSDATTYLARLEATPTP